MTIDLLNSGRPFFSRLPNGIYDIIRFLEPGLMVDCGAAVGGVTAKLRAASPKSPVIAFEPFPGNHRYFEQRHAQDPLVTLYKAAVGAKRGTASFFTPSTVRSASRIKATPDASFIGRIDDERPPDGNKVISVDVLPLDEVCAERVRFLKVDVQGGECATLEGAAKLIENRAIDVIYIELFQNPELLLKMGALGFVMFDNEYVVSPRPGGDISRWVKTEDLILSTGQSSFRGWPVNMPTQIEDYNRWVERESAVAGPLSTDLVAVRQSFLPDLLEATAKALRAIETAG